MKIGFLGDCKVDDGDGEALCRFFAESKEADYVVLNFETAVADQADPIEQKSRFVMASYDSLELFFERIHVPVILNLNNNHILDAGRQALADLCSYLDEQDILYMGGKEPVVLDEGGSPVVLWGLFNYDELQGFKTIDGYLTIEEIRKKVACTAGQFVVCMHWGEEYVYMPAPSQYQAAVKLAESGVHLIVGSHPHVVQGFSVLGECEVYFSLGNGAFTMPANRYATSLGVFLLANIETDSVRTNPSPIIYSGGSLRFFPEDRISEFIHLFRQLRTREQKFEWYTEAGIPFLSNHLYSWLMRINKYGLSEGVRFIRALFSKTYLLMIIGAVCGVFRCSKNQSINAKFTKLVGGISTKQCD